MKRFVLLVLALVGMYSITMAQSKTSSKTLVKTLNPQESSSITLDFEHPAEIKQWPEDNIRVLMEVTLENGNENVLKQLMKVGRYNLDPVKEGDAFKVTMPGMQKMVKLKGVPLIEKITAVVFVPEYSKVKVKEIDGSGTVVYVEPEFTPKGNMQVFKSIDYNINLNAERSTEENVDWKALGIEFVERPAKKSTGKKVIKEKRIEIEKDASKKSKIKIISNADGTKRIIKDKHIIIINDDTNLEDLDLDKETLDLLKEEGIELNSSKKGEKKVIILKEEREEVIENDKE